MQIITDAFALAGLVVAIAPYVKADAISRVAFVECTDRRASYYDVEGNEVAAVFPDGSVSCAWPDAA